MFQQRNELIVGKLFAGAPGIFDVAVKHDPGGGDLAAFLQVIHQRDQRLHLFFRRIIPRKIPNKTDPQPVLIVFIDPGVSSMDLFLPPERRLHNAVLRSSSVADDEVVSDAAPAEFFPVMFVERSGAAGSRGAVMDHDIIPLAFQLDSQGPIRIDRGRNAETGVFGFFGYGK